MDIGIDSFAAILPDPTTGALPSATDRMAELLEEVEVADRVGLDVFGIGEHHRAEFLDSAPSIILAAAAARTSRIRLTSAVTILSAADPVRVFQEFATIDLISRGRAELVVGRGSFGEAFPLFGLDTRAYDELFAENLALFLKLGETSHPTWQGRFRPALNGQGVFPRPHQPRLPVWVGVGGSPQSFARAGTLGLPLMVAIIGGTFDRFRPAVDSYREAGAEAGHDPAKLKVGIHAMGFVGETDAAARDAFFPGWAHLTGKVGRLVAADTRAVRRHGRPGGRVPGRQPGNGGGQDVARQRGAGRRLPHHLPNEYRVARNGRDEKVDRIPRC